ITTPAYLTIAGQIVSVEARHAALIADLISNGTFSNTTDANGLDKAMTPAQVLAAADPFIVTVLNASNLPTS
ncbi:MAG: ferritin-like domain-containing protein, partial [Chitinophagaceae bacterium]